HRKTKMVRSIAEARSARTDLQATLRAGRVPASNSMRVATAIEAYLAAIDSIAPEKSGSRVRTVVNAVRSLYGWAQDRELVDRDPASRVRLPAMNATPR